MSEIEPMLGKWEAVAPAYIVERVLLALCTETSKLIDESKIAGPATLKLSIALADSGIRDRGTVKRSSVR
jgi:hypothetical protein